MRAIRRDDDDELCGYVRGDGARWQALTVFHGVIATFDDEAAAARHVVEQGLASLQARWRHRRGPDDDWQTVLIQEARPGRVRLIEGYYPMPGAPTRVVTADDLAAGGELERLPG